MRYAFLSKCLPVQKEWAVRYLVTDQYSGSPRHNGFARCLRAVGGTSYHPVFKVREISLISGSFACAPHFLHLYPFPFPSLVIRLLQEVQIGGRVVDPFESALTLSFSRLILPFLKLPTAITSSPGISWRTTWRKFFVGS